MKENNVIVEKSKAFALKIIRTYKHLNENKECVLSKQLLRCGTSIGANVHEGIRGQSRPDFYAKLNIALKEASECSYWLELLYQSEYLDAKAYGILYSDCEELIRILVAITKSQKEFE